MGNRESSKNRLKYKLQDLIDIEQFQVLQDRLAKKGRVLLMDDEELVRNVAKEMIEALGHEVQCAADGETAIEMVRDAGESGSQLDVAILDLTVRGGMGGEETVRRLGEIDPGVVAVVSSGYADNTVVADFRKYGFSAFLNKPYKIDALRDCLNGLMGQTEGRR